MQEQQSKLNVEINNIEFDIFDIHSWYNKIEIKENDKITKTQNDILILKLKYLLPFIQLQLKKTTKNESDKLKSVIADITEIIDYFELSNKLNKEGNKSSNIFFNYLKEKNIYIPHLESWIYPEEMKKWSNAKLYSEYIKSSENGLWSYAYNCISVLSYNNVKLKIIIPNTIEEFKNKIENITKNLKENLNINYMIIPEIIRPEITTQCSFLAFDIIGFSNTENNDEIDMLDYFEDMLKQFRYEMGKIKEITPQDVAVLYVGDCLAISLKCNNHAEILFNFTKKISKQKQFDKYTFALHTGESYWINFKEYEETPFKQLIHPEVNYLFRLIGKAKNENYIYISKKMYEALQNKPSFKQEQQSIISDEKEDNETIAQNIYYTQQIKHNYFVEYIKFKRR